MLLYNIVIDVPLDKLFTYKSDTKLTIGTRVLVEFKNKKVVGFIWEHVLLENIDYDILKIKPILSIFNECLSVQSIKLVKFIKKYYHANIGQCVFTVIPSLIRKPRELQINLPKRLHLNNNSDNFLVDITVKSDKKSSQALAQSDIKVENLLPLNGEQANVVNVISSDIKSYKVTILHGITGSGKTEVYLELIRIIIQSGKQVLVLVPEINLTPQLLSRFKKRFPNVRIDILTSNIGNKDRVRSYLMAETGISQIIIGTRMAVFTPFKNLGLIIVDEEHDPSFKQNEGLRYNARDIAVYKAKYFDIPILLGSATPSLETLYNYKLGKYQLLQLLSRGVEGAQLPMVRLIDIKNEQLIEGLSVVVVEAIKDRLKNNELTLVYINRRGYAPIISCYNCGWVGNCKNCSSNMVYHTINSRLKCHHCGYGCTLPIKCPKCSSGYLKSIGQGTQKIEEKLGEIFIDAKILRVDQDTTSSKSAWDNLYNKINNNEVDILVGTQMLTKGHDFHNLTLVVGLNLDTGLYSYDFRATEYLFTQLMQVAGRAGRGGKKGEVLLQTHYKEHELYRFLLNHDYQGFVNYLLTQRKFLQLPPYNFYVLVRASSQKISKTMEFLHKVYDILQQCKINKIEVFEPVVSVIQKIKNRERGQILISCINRSSLHEFLDIVISKINSVKHTNDLLWYLDVDPVDM